MTSYDISPGLANYFKRIISKTVYLDIIGGEYDLLMGYLDWMSSYDPHSWVHVYNGRKRLTSDQILFLLCCHYLSNNRVYKPCRVVFTDAAVKFVEGEFPA